MYAFNAYMCRNVYLCVLWAALRSPVHCSPALLESQQKSAFLPSILSRLTSSLRNWVHLYRMQFSTSLIVIIVQWNCSLLKPGLWFFIAHLMHGIRLWCAYLESWCMFCHYRLYQYLGGYLLWTINACWSTVSRWFLSTCISIHLSGNWFYMYMQRVYWGYFGNTGLLDGMRQKSRPGTVFLSLEVHACSNSNCADEQLLWSPNGQSPILLCCHFSVTSALLWSPASGHSLSPVATPVCLQSIWLALWRSWSILVMQQGAQNWLQLLASQVASFSFHFPSLFPNSSPLWRSLCSSRFKRPYTAEYGCTH